MCTFTVGEVQLYYERKGDRGEPLVFVHGATGDITDWRFQKADFAPTHRVLVMDLRGHGRSTAPTDRASYTIDAMVRDVEALIAHAGFVRYHLVGHSMGGAIAQEIALRSQDSLASLTLFDTGFAHPRVLDERQVQFNERRHRIAEEEGMAALASRSSTQIRRAPHMPVERQAEEAERFSRMSVDAFIGTSAGIAAWPGTRDRLSGLRVPTLIICGELDVPFLKATERMAERMPNAVRHIIPQAAHSPQYERPGLFNPLLRDHITRHRLQPAVP